MCALVTISVHEILESFELQSSQNLSAPNSTV